jgi:ketosteroid isomerase-like protein
LGRLLLLLSLGIILGGIATGQSATKNAADAVEEAKKEILKLEDELVRALQTSSAATADFYDRVLTDDASLTISDGSVITKTEHVAKFRSGEKQLRSVHRDDTRVHIYGNTAVVTFLSETTHFKPKDDRTRLRNRTTNVWIKSDGVWRLVAHSVTPLPTE